MMSGVETSITSQVLLLLLPEPHFEPHLWTQNKEQRGCEPKADSCAQPFEKWCTTTAFSTTEHLNLQSTQFFSISLSGNSL